MRAFITAMILALCVSTSSAQGIPFPLLPMPAPPLPELFSPVEASRPEPVLDSIQKATVCIDTKDGIGSGVVQKFGNEIYVWTVYHVVRDIEEGGTIDAVQEVSVDDNGAVHKRVHLKVIAFDSERDIAVLRANGDIGKHVDFKDQRKQGTALWHVGSWRGLNYINSVSDGVVSNVSRNIGDGITRDQSTCTIFPGSSGGGMFEKSTGKCIGLLSTYRDPTFNHYVPVRDLERFAKSNNIPFGD